MVDVRDVITWFKFGDDRLRGLGSAEGQSLPFRIDFDGRPYNTLTLPCDRVISFRLTKLLVVDDRNSAIFLFLKSCSVCSVFFIELGVCYCACECQLQLLI